MSVSSSATTGTSLGPSSHNVSKTIGKSHYAKPGGAPAQSLASASASTASSVLFSSGAKAPSPVTTTAPVTITTRTDRIDSSAGGGASVAVSSSSSSAPVTTTSGSGAGTTVTTTATAVSSSSDNLTTTSTTTSSTTTSGTSTLLSRSTGYSSGLGTGIGLTGTGQSGGSGAGAGGQGLMDKLRLDDSQRKSSSLSGRYNTPSSSSLAYGGLNCNTSTSNTMLGGGLGTTSGSGGSGMGTTTNGTGVGAGNANLNNIGNGSAAGHGHANGSSLTGTGALGSGPYSINTGNYRLASLDRLANRQKLYDHQNGGGDSLQSKRELFFKNESSPAPALVTSIKTESSGPPSSNFGMVGSGGGPTMVSMNKPDLPPVSVKIEAHRSHAHAHPHHPNVNMNMNANNMMEDNREKESKEKMKEKDKRRKELDGYVGFANLPNQVYRKAVKKGFDFTLMVVGESGLGKSTLINSMFLADIYSQEYPGPSHRIKKTVQVETCKVLMKENGVNLTLTIVDTPGFGDAVDNSNCWQPVMDYIENRYEDYLNSESRVNRKMMMDSRVHCCLYFIAPSGHGLKPLDIELMKKLHDKVNIIPVLAKADTMTPEECAHFKKQVLNEIGTHKIKIYEFPDCDDEEENKVNKMMRDRVPFAVVGSNTVIEIDGKKVRGRKYPWGTVIVESMEHCDFVPLRNMVVRTHLQDLKDVTNNVHYENFRCRKLAGLGPDGKPLKVFGDKNPLAQMEDERKSHEQKMKKMETEMEQVFELKVKERNQRIVDSENDLQRREVQMKNSLEKLQKDVEDKKKHYESEKYSWEQANGITFEELRRRSLEAQSKEACKGNKMSMMKGQSQNQGIPGISIEEPSPLASIKFSSSNDSTDAKNRVKRSKSMPKQHRTSFRGQECTQS